MTDKPLRYALLAGTEYFVAMGIAHFVGFKVPLLFVYWNNPYFAYQDKIISFAVFTYAALFYTAARHRVAVPAALFSITVTVLGLALVNLSDALGITLAEGKKEIAEWTVQWSGSTDAARSGLSTAPYWAQTALIAVYAAVLYALHFRSKGSAGAAEAAPR